MPPSTKSRSRDGGAPSAEAGNGGPPEVQQIQIPALEVATVEVPIEGETPLIVNRWSEKARRTMLEAQTGRARKKKDPKDPEKDYQAAKYRLEDGREGMPATAFKAAIVDGARLCEGVTMTALKQWVRVTGEGPDQLVPILGESRMREDTPRNANGVADLRYRPEYWPWSAVLVIRFPRQALTDEALVNLVNAGGLAGVGDWRPSSPKSKTGIYGTFRVREGEVE